MTLLENLKAKIAREETKPFEYACRDCQATFSSTKSDPETVTCPSCGSHNIRAPSVEETSTFVPTQF